MPSPDLTPYVDLRFFDRDAQMVLDAAISELQTRLPGWQPSPLNTEQILLEAFALEVSESIFAVNRIPNAIMVILAKLYGIPRDEGAAPMTVIRFNAADTNGYVVPTGTQARLALSGGYLPLVFTTTTNLTIPSGSATGTVAARADRFTSEGNGATVGTVLDVLTPLQFIDSAVLSSVVANGRGFEQDVDWLTRVVQRFSRLSDVLVLPRHFVAAALERPEVFRAFSLDQYDPGQTPPTGRGGHQTLVVYGENAPLTDEQKQDIVEDLSSSMSIDLELHLVDPTINTVDVSVTVKCLPLFDTAEVEANVERTIRDYLNPASWDWSTVLRRNILIGLIQNTRGVDYMSNLTPTNDVTLVGDAPLLKVGVLDVTAVS